MDKRKMTIFAALIAMIIVFAIFSSFWGVLFSTGGSIPVVWPASPVDNEAAVPDTNAVLAKGYHRIQITPDTVQDVIATLERPAQYAQTVQLTLFWGDENTKSTATAACAAYNDVFAAKMTQNGRIQYSILADNTLYRWYQGERSWYQGTSAFLTADLLSRIPSYETVLSLPKDQIISAQSVVLGEQTCIFVESFDPVLEIKSHYWIDASQGLLLKAEGYWQKKMIWSAEVSESSASVDDSLFVLPNGTDVRKLAS